MMDAMGGRKFLLAIIGMSVGAVLQYKSGQAVNEAFTALIIGIVASFSAANAYVTAKGADGTITAPEPTVMPDEPALIKVPPLEVAPQPDLSLVINALTELNSKVDSMGGALVAVSDQAKAANKNASAALQAIAGR